MSFVGFALELGGDVSSFTPSVQDQMQSAIAAQAGVGLSAVELAISPGSVIVDVSIQTPTATAASVQSAMASATSSPSSATAMLASVTGVSIAVLAVVTPPTIANANAAPPPPPSPSPPLPMSPKPSDPTGVIIGVVVGVILALALALVILHRRRRDMRRKPIVATRAVAPTKSSSADGTSDSHSSTSSSDMVSSIALSEGASASAKARMTRAQELLKAWELDVREITILEKQLGEGGQGVVVRGLWHGIEVAIKQPRPPKGRTGKRNAFGSTSALDSYNQALRREVRALSRVRHPNVIKLHGVCFGPAPMLLMSYAPSGTLQDALDDHKFQTPSEMVRLLAGIARGMEAVHAHKIIHLDLKPENVLIGPLDVPWITDFGLSTSSNMTSMSQSTVGGRGTLPFKAPELFAHPPHVGPEADVYAFAILAWIVVSGEQPYTNMLAAATSLPQAVAQGVRPTLADPNEEWQDKTTLPMVRLIEGCWHADSAQRPTFGSGSGEGAEGGEGGGKGVRSRVVAMLEKMEHSFSKGSDLEASQLALAMRLISTESEAETLSISLVQIGAAQGDATTTAAEQTELAEEKAALETSQGLLRQHAFAVLSQMPGGTGGELASALSAMLLQQSDMFRHAMLETEAKMQSLERSLSRLAEGELDCPRLFVLLPMEASSSKLMQLVKREFVRDKYRLVFLDPVTGCAVRCGPDGDGYKLEVPKKWLVENRKIISAALHIVKSCVMAGRLAGLPLPSAAGLPAQAVSKAEIEALKTFEAVYSGEGVLGDDASSTSSSASPSAAKAVKAATGQVYKQLRKMLKEQCKDEYLVHCEMTKEKARDGSIEFVSAGSKERFLHFGQQALIWNDETLKQKAAAKAAALREVEATALREVEAMAAAPAGKAKAVPFSTGAGEMAGPEPKPTAAAKPPELQNMLIVSSFLEVFTPKREGV